MPDSTMSFLDLSISQDLVDPARHIFELCPISRLKNAWLEGRELSEKKSAVLGQGRCLHFPTWQFLQVAEVEVVLNGDELLY